MYPNKPWNTLLSLALLLCASTVSNAATLAIDLDIHTSGIQSSATLVPGNDYQFKVVFSGDGSTVFDTFALDVVHDTSGVAVHSPLAGAAVDRAPLMAFDIHGTTQVSANDSLTPGTMPHPLGFEGALGGIGVSSLGGMPFSLIGEDQTIGFFSTSLTPLSTGTTTLELTGYPFGIGTGLNLAGEHAPVVPQGAIITVVPVPLALWLFVSGLLGLLGIGKMRGVRTQYCRLRKTSARNWLLLAIALTLPAMAYASADLNDDAIVNSQDISLLANCFGQEPVSDCARADVDEDGDIDADDFSFISERLGQAYPERLFPEPLATDSLPNSAYLGDLNRDGVLDMVAVSSVNNGLFVLLGDGDGSFQTPQDFAGGETIDLGDLNGDGVLDAVTASYNSDDISVLIGNGDGTFQQPLFFTIIDGPYSPILGDLNNDGVLDVVTTNYRNNNISVLLGNGDGGFQTQHRFAVDSRGQTSLHDMNGDGVLDVVVINSGCCCSILLGNGDGSFQSSHRLNAYYSFYKSALGDLNGDGEIDVVTVVGHDPSSYIFVLLGNNH
jgi:hypothetical protein